MGEAVVVHLEHDLRVLVQQDFVAVTIAAKRTMSAKTAPNISSSRPPGLRADSRRNTRANSSAGKRINVARISVLRN